MRVLRIVMIALVVAIAAVWLVSCAAEENSFTLEGLLRGGNYGRLELVLLEVVAASDESLEGFFVENLCSALTFREVGDSKVTSPEGKTVPLTEVRPGTHVRIEGYRHTDHGLIFNSVRVLPPREKGSCVTVP